MRRLALHRPKTDSEPVLPDASSVYETALEELTRWHEFEAAALLAGCTLTIEEASTSWPFEGVTPVKARLLGSRPVVEELERSAELRGRIRQVIDRALGPTVYLASLEAGTRSDVVAIAA
jgi:hypothetical protein